MSKAEEFHIGDIVETIKGAKFWGKITALENDEDDNPGALVRAFAPGFEGVKHVYPLKQIGHRAALSSQEEEIEGLKRGLEQIAKQKLSYELPLADRGHADFEGGYDTAVKFARGLLEGSKR